MLKSREDRFLELISCIDINNPVMDFDYYGNKLFWFDNNGEWICEYDLRNGWFWISYDKVWSVFYNEYGLNYTEIQSFMEGMVEEHFKLKDVTPQRQAIRIGHEVEQHFKLNGTI